MRRFLVASFLADVTQQIHSFLARGVISVHRRFAAALDSMAFRKSAGSLWTVPPAIFWVIMFHIVPVSANDKMTDRPGCAVGIKLHMTVRYGAGGLFGPSTLFRDSFRSATSSTLAYLTLILPSGAPFWFVKYFQVPS